MNAAKQERLDSRQLYSGFIRLHILHHAAKDGIFGLGMIEELARHGYKLSPGTHRRMLIPVRTDPSQSGGPESTDDTQNIHA